MKSKKVILVLYSELMPYNIAAFECLVNNFDVEVYIIRWNKKVLTPFKPESNTGLKLFNRSDFNVSSILKLAIEINPSMVLVSGWMDKDYKKACGILLKRGKTIISGIDNHWEGSIRQVIASKLSCFLLKPYYSKLFVAGIHQYEFARKMGYSYNNIILGLYTADTEVFHKYYKPKIENPKKILFVGRFESVKGLELLGETFQEITSKEEYFGWQLILVGNGSLKERLSNISNVSVHNFLPQTEISKICQMVSFFVLPSLKEPWGVVIHEMASAGLPLLLSKACGAASEFLIDDYNGRIFETDDKDSLKSNLKYMMDKSINDLNTMGQRSFQMSKKNSPMIWSYRLYNSMIN